MIRNRPVRRVAAVLLVLLGAVVMWLSTAVGTGLVMFAVGVLLEGVGLALEHRDTR